MSKNNLSNLFYGLSILALVASIYFKRNNQEIEILYWLGVLFFAAGYIVKATIKKKEKV